MDIDYGLVKWTQATEPVNDVNAFDVWYHSDQERWYIRNDQNAGWWLNVDVSEIYNTGIFAGGGGAFFYDRIDYIDITTLGDALDFGNLTEHRGKLAGCSNGTNNRGVFGGGEDTTGLIDFVTTISTPCNAFYFGELSVVRNYLASCSNGNNQRGIFAGGEDVLAAVTDVIDYITINSEGNAFDFGNLSVARDELTAVSNLIGGYGVFAGGDTGAISNVMDYINISALGNATDFGDLTAAKSGLAGCSNSSGGIGVFGGGTIGGPALTNIIEYIQIGFPSNAIDSGGTLTVARDSLTATSNGVSSRGVFGGGNDGGVSDVIDYVLITALGAGAGDFGDLTVAREYLGSTSNSN